MSKNIHRRHGENIHKMEEIPEKPVFKGPSPDLGLESRGNRPPAEIKRITRQAAQRHSKKNAAQSKK